MKMKKILSVILASCMIMAMMVGCSSGNKATSDETKQQTTVTNVPEVTSEGTETADAESGDVIGEPFADTVKISLMNSKPEITDALEEGAKLFGEKYNVEIEIYETDSPGDVIAQKYASGDAPTLAIVDNANVLDLSAEKILDLSDQQWCEVGGKELGAVVDGKVYGMPLTIEGMCLLYNKTVIEKLTGHEFNPEECTTLDEFSALLDELKTAGMKSPVVLNAEDWSIGQKSYQFIYDYQDGTAAGAVSFLNDIHDGKTTFIDNDIFNKVYDAMDLFIANNINQADPLAADYDLNASYVAEGKAAFWLNGTWAWPDFEPYVVDGNEYGVLAFPFNDEPETAGKIVACATKFVTIDGVNATEEQQKAAKMFLNWLVFDAEGQDVLINKCGIVTAFTNIDMEPNNPFNIGLKDYIDKGMTVEGATYMPSDHRSSLAAYMQAYVNETMTREEIAEKLNEYWITNTPTTNIAK